MGNGISSRENFPWDQADAMFLLLLKRVAELQAGREAIAEEELDCVTSAIDAYEAKRWPLRDVES